jgi:hypothetical protein
MYVAKPNAVLGGTPLFTRHLGVIAGATWCRRADVRRFTNRDFALAIRRGTVRQAAATRIGAMAASLPLDLPLCCGREFVSVAFLRHMKGNPAQVPELFSRTCESANL